MITVRSGLVALASLLGALSPLACSGSGAALDEPLGEDQSLLKEGACIGEVLGGPTSCKPADVWKKYAYESCASRGLELSDLALGAACKGGHVEAKFACCKTPPKPVPPPVPGPGTCFADAQGGPTSCKPAEVWTKYASDVCLAKGAQISQIAFAEECGEGAFRWSKYECCDGAAPTPPPPVACKATELGDPTSCKPNGTWKEHAFNHCAEQKLTLTSLSLGEACGKDASRSVKVECCEAYPVPPPEPKDPGPLPPKDPPPPPSCEGHYEGGPGSCKDPGTWKVYADEACAKAGAKLADIGYGASCGAAGAVSEIKYVCCK